MPVHSWKMSGYINIIIRLADRVGFKKFSLVAHSFGGGLAVKIAIMYPERIDKLVLCAPAITIENKTALRQKFALFLAKISFFFFNKSVFLKNKFFSVARNINEYVAGTDDYYLARDKMIGTFDSIFEDDIYYALYAIKSPTLLIWGDRDKAMPIKDAVVIKRKINNAKLVIIKGANHALHLQPPEKIAGIMLNFLQNLYEGRKNNN